jgi:hypothetical protein
MNFESKKSVQKKSNPEKYNSEKSQSEKSAHPPSHSHSHSHSHSYSPFASNPVLWVTCGLLVAVVVASFVTLGLVLTHPDPEMTDAAPQRNVMMR